MRYVYKSLAILTFFLLVGGALLPASSASSENAVDDPECLAVDVGWEGRKVAWITVNIAPTPGVTPRAEVGLTDENNHSVFFKIVTGESEFTLYPGLEAETVFVRSGWRPGPLCPFEENAPVSSPAVTPAPSPIEEIPTPAVGIVESTEIRTLHSR